MEARVTRLEEDSKALRETMTEIRVSLARLPTYGQMWTMWGVAAAIGFGLLGVLFGGLAWLK